MTTGQTLNKLDAQLLQLQTKIRQEELNPPGVPISLLVTLIAMYIIERGKHRGR